MKNTSCFFFFFCFFFLLLLFLFCFFFYLKNFQFLEVKFSIYLNRRVFVMLLAQNLALNTDAVPNYILCGPQKGLLPHQ